MSTLDTNTRLCPGCGTINGIQSLISKGYRCAQCNLEVAYLDLAANGLVRGVFGWLHCLDDIVDGRYRVKSLLGKGGFGATFLVEDLRINGKRRAIKEIPELLFDEYETALLSKLNHPAIPDIIDRNVADGMVRLVLEFGGARTLADEQRKSGGRISEARLIAWMSQLCDVLIYLHSQNPPIIHRDLKPDNILLDENGRIMLIDFGIAKQVEPEGVTRTLGRAASHGFSPPEQAMGSGTDRRSDVYSLAATFYALLTGENPPAAHERVAGHVLKSPSEVVSDISPQIESAIMKALTLNVNHRFQTIFEFARAIDESFPETQSSSDNIEATSRTVDMVNSQSNATDKTILLTPKSKFPSHSTFSQRNLGSQTTDHTEIGLNFKILVLVGVLVFVMSAVGVGLYVRFKNSERAKSPENKQEASNTMLIVPPSAHFEKANADDDQEAVKTSLQPVASPGPELNSQNEIQSKDSAPKVTRSKPVEGKQQVTSGSATDVFNKYRSRSEESVAEPQAIPKQENTPKPDRSVVKNPEPTRRKSASVLPSKKEATQSTSAMPEGPVFKIMPAGSRRID